MPDGLLSSHLHGGCPSRFARFASGADPADAIEPILGCKAPPPLTTAKLEEDETNDQCAIDDDKRQFGGMRCQLFKHFLISIRLEYRRHWAP
jgi:hypothetical protein